MSLDVIAHNVRNQRNKRTMGDELDQLLHRHDTAHMVGLFEAREYDEVIERRARKHGYRTFQCAPERLTAEQRRRRVQEERANVALLVREDVELHKVVPWFMHQPWTGPKAGLPHRPRVYVRANVTVAGERWRGAFAHWPTPIGNQDAMDETYRRTEAFLRNATHAGVPAFVAGDLNQSRAKLNDRLPKVITGHHVDQLAANHLVVGASQVLDRFGSDHPAIRYELHRKVVRR